MNQCHPNLQTPTPHIKSILDDKKSKPRARENETHKTEKKDRSLVHTKLAQMNINVKPSK